MKCLYVKRRALFNLIVVFASCLLGIKAVAQGQKFHAYLGGEVGYLQTHYTSRFGTSSGQYPYYSVHFSYKKRQGREIGPIANMGFGYGRADFKISLGKLFTIAGDGIYNNPVLKEIAVCLQLNSSTSPLKVAHQLSVGTIGNTEWSTVGRSKYLGSGLVLCRSNVVFNANVNLYFREDEQWYYLAPELGKGYGSFRHWSFNVRIGTRLTPGMLKGIFNKQESNKESIN